MKSSENNGHTIGDYTVDNIFLRMDGSEVTKFMPSGGGTVNCQVKAGPWEKFNIEKQANGTYTIESIAFPGVYLRMDGRGVNESNPIGGVVNCQLGAGPWEKFKISIHLYGYSIESVSFPGVFLRMDSDNCSVNSAPGCGSISCSFGPEITAPVRGLFYIKPLLG